MKRVVVTLHLPLPMGAAGAILKEVARQFPDAVVDEGFRVHADPDLTRAEAQRLVRERRTAVAS